MLDIQTWVEGNIINIYEDCSDVWVTISDLNNNSLSFDFRISGEFKEVPFDREWWEDNKGKKVRVSLMVQTMD